MINPETTYHVRYKVENKDRPGGHIYSKNVTKNQYDFYKDNIGYEIDHPDYIEHVESVYILNDIDVNKELCEIINKMAEIENRVDNDTFDTFTQEILDYIDNSDDYLI